MAKEVSCLKKDRKTQWVKEQMETKEKEDRQRWRKHMGCSLDKTCSFKFDILCCIRFKDWKDETLQSKGKIYLALLCRVHAQSFDLLTTFAFFSWKNHPDTNVEEVVIQTNRHILKDGLERWKCNDGPTGGKNEERSWLKGNQSQAVSPCTIL